MNKEIELKPCREAFEAHCKSRGFDNFAITADDAVVAKKYPDNTYTWNYVEELWLAFRAGEAQLQAENVRLRKALEYYAPLTYGSVAKAALQHNEAL